MPLGIYTVYLSVFFEIHTVKVFTYPIFSLFSDYFQHIFKIWHWICKMAKRMWRIL